MGRRWLAGAALGLALAVTQVVPGVEAGGQAGKAGKLSIGGDTGTSHLVSDARGGATGGTTSKGGKGGTTGTGIGFEGGD